MLMSPIPCFPTFKKLELSDKNVIENVTSQFNAYSDFNFASLWNYDTESTIEWSLLHDNLVVQFADYITGHPFLSFIGHKKIIETVRTLLDYTTSHNLPHYLKLVPQEVIDSEPSLSSAFKIVEDSHNHDYILSVEEYLTYSGQKFASKRKNVRKFTEAFPDAKVELLDLSDKTTQDEIIALFYAWTKIRKVPKDEYIHELKATQRFIKASNHFNYIALGIRNGSQLLAYSLIEKEPKTFLQHHFLKTLTKHEYKGCLLYTSRCV